MLRLAALPAEQFFQLLPRTVRCRSCGAEAALGILPLDARQVEHAPGCPIGASFRRSPKPIVLAGRPTGGRVQ